MASDNFRNKKRNLSQHQSVIHMAIEPATTIRAFVFNNDLDTAYSILKKTGAEFDLLWDNLQIMNKILNKEKHILALENSLVLLQTIQENNLDLPKMTLEKFSQARMEQLSIKNENYQKMVLFATGNNKVLAYNFYQTTDADWDIFAIKTVFYIAGFSSTLEPKTTIFKLE
jgi:hypothetical protein